MVNMIVTFFTSFTTTTTLLTVRTTLQMRFVINGTSAGVDFIFPLQTMAVDLTELTILSAPMNNTPLILILY
jgi:hypothetical protein